MATLKTAITDWYRAKTQSSTPATPSIGYGIFYDKDKAPYFKNSDGVESALGVAVAAVNRFPNYAAGVSKSVNVVYQAVTDGWLCVTFRGAYMNDMSLLVGTTSTPVTLVAWWGDDINSNTKWGSWMIPIPKDIYYKVVDGVETTNITFFPVIG